MQFDDAVLDEILTLQLAVAWAGERGAPGEDDTCRMGWWATCAVDEFGGEELYTRLLPDTAAWAVLETARRGAWCAEERTLKTHNQPVQTLFHLAPEVDEALEDRLYAHKLSGDDVGARLPGLAALIERCGGEAFDEGAFRAWAGDLCPVTFKDVVVGRQVQGDVGAPLEVARRCVAALQAPTQRAKTWPLPHMIP